MFYVLPVSRKWDFMSEVVYLYAEITIVLEEEEFIA